MRATKKEYQDDYKEIYRELIQVNNLVLVQDSIREINMSRNRKLTLRQLSSYRVKKAYKDISTYKLEDLNSIEFARTTPSKRLKKFI